MTRTDRTAREAELISWLVGYDEAIGAGAPGGVPGPADLPPDLLPRLQGVMSCLHRLDRAWPRGGSRTAPIPEVGSFPPAEALTRGGGQAEDSPPTGREPGQGPCVRPDWVPGFEILEWIGGGGMGDVYRARQTSLDREVALKILRPAFAADASRLARFRREAEVAAKLRDTHLLPVYDVLEVRGVPVLILPLVDGCDLGQILSDRKRVQGGELTKGRHPWAALDDADFVQRILPVLDQVVEAVAVLHAAGVLHRDIKPSNVLVDGRGNVLLSDFGLARLGEESTLTTPGFELGTPGFMSPEQWAGTADIDARADLFGLGVTLYQALTLQWPYGRVRLTTDGTPPVAVSAHQPLLAADFDAVVLRALELDRDDRYATAAELQNDWRCVREGQAPKATRPGRLRRAARRTRRQTPSVVRVAALTSLCGAVGFLSIKGLLDPGHDPVVPTMPPSVARAVRIETEPPGARIVFVPIDPAGGQLQPARAIALQDQRTPVSLRLLPGDYAVEVLLDDGRFHEVRRYVPRPGESRQLYYQTGSTTSADGSLMLAPIKLPPPTVLDGMVRFQGGTAPARPGDRDSGRSTSDQGLPPFYLDRTEVTWAGYLKAMSAPPFHAPFGIRGSASDEAARFLTYEEAMTCAELMGKRLPDQWEYECASTAGGTRTYPWGDRPRSQLDPSWSFGPVGQPAFDRTNGPNPVLGLYSNVAEWTSSVSTLRAQGAAASLTTILHQDPVARGAPPSVVQGQPEPSEFDLGPRHRLVLRRGSHYPGVGFRCARSAQPRFLKAGP